MKGTESLEKEAHASRCKTVCSFHTEELSPKLGLELTAAFGAGVALLHLISTWLPAPAVHLTFLPFLKRIILLTAAPAGALHAYNCVAAIHIKRRLEHGAEKKLSVSAPNRDNTPDRKWLECQVPEEAAARQPLPTEFAFQEDRMDQLIRFDARWVFVYSLLYYSLFVSGAFYARDDADFCTFLVGVILLISAHAALWLYFPTTLPLSLRVQKEALLSIETGNRHMRSTSAEHFLRLIQRTDGQNTNTIPSMHCSVAAHICWFLYYTFASSTLALQSGEPVDKPAGAVVQIPDNKLTAFLAAVPVIVAFSCVATKQHAFWDTVCGLLFGSIVFWLERLVGLA